MFLNSSSLVVLVNGNPVHEYVHNGSTFIEGRKGHSYEIKFTNSSSVRKKIVVSCDGLNIMTGDKKWDRGYSVEPWQSIVIPGWRKDADNVAKFVFSDISSSYNQHNVSGDENNIGVIGCMVFPEVQKLNPVYQYSYSYIPNYLYTITSGGGWSLGSETTGASYIGDSYRGFSVSDRVSSAIPSGIGQNYCNFVSSAEPQSVGTGWGDNQDFKTGTVHYEFEKSPETKMLIYYDSYRGLEHRGIINKPTYTKRQPEAFPNYSGGCPNPV